LRDPSLRPHRGPHMRDITRGNPLEGLTLGDAP
jgi:hypothetical protein